MATYLTESEQVRSMGNLPRETESTDMLPDSRLREHLASAARTLKRWVGATAYATALADVDAAREAIGEGETWPDDASFSDAVKTEALREAECKLALASLLPHLNRITPGRGVMASVANPAGGSVSVRSSAEIEMEQRRLTREATDAVRAYLQQGYPSAGISYRKDEAGNVDS